MGIIRKEQDEEEGPWNTVSLILPESLASSAQRTAARSIPAAALLVAPRLLAAMSARTHLASAVMRNGHVAPAEQQMHDKRRRGGERAKWKQRRWEVATGGEVAGLGPGGVAGEEAAEGGGAVALQPRPQQLHPFLQQHAAEQSESVGGATRSAAVLRIGGRRR